MARVLMGRGVKGMWPGLQNMDWGQRAGSSAPGGYVFQGFNGREIGDVYGTNVIQVQVKKLRAVWSGCVWVLSCRSWAPYTFDTPARAALPI